ncbi:ParB N-terminal domain-containing protein [Rhodococcus qingshengii]|uniref:ParB N-terminal domain-containing protein n=1 Tax=Rhodococcus qingshengii TaxID=334542 RepID=UPI0030CD00A1
MRQPEQIAVDKLDLDPFNPRLPESIVGQPQTRLLRWLFDHGTLGELAVSMADTGFFQNEPLIAVPEGDRFVVVEGNRRLATLKILLQSDVATSSDIPPFDIQGFTPDAARRLEEVPCVVVDTRSEVRKFLGFRHIGGIKTWSAEAKARFIAEEVESAVEMGIQNPFRHVGRITGSNATGVRNPYLALTLLRAAREEFGIESDQLQADRFGVWNRALNSSEIRQYIGLGETATVDDIKKSSVQVNPEKLNEVIRDITPDENGRAVLSDSRQVTLYASILMDDRARNILHETGNLNLASQAVRADNLALSLDEIITRLKVLQDTIGDDPITDEAFSKAKMVRISAINLFAALSAHNDIQRADDE